MNSRISVALSVSVMMILSSLLAAFVPVTSAFGQADPSTNATANADIAVIADFNASKGQLPEGIAMLGESAFVSFAPLAQVVGIGINNSGAASNQNASFVEFGSWPDIPENKGYMTGLAFDGQENLYAAIGSQAPEVKSGVYRVGVSGGNATLFATHPKMQFPNALVFDRAGQLYVSDSSAGVIFLAHRNGTVAEWMAHPLLQGNSSFCQNVPDLGMNVGANGIVLDKSELSLFVANTDKASIIEIPIGINGSAGEPEVLAGPDCKNLAGVDGMVVDKDANALIVAANKLDKIVRVSIDDGALSVLASGGMLDFPASLAIGGDRDSDNFVGQFENGANATEASSNRTLYITNFALLSAQQDEPNANPALLTMELGAESNMTSQIQLR